MACFMDINSDDYAKNLLKDLPGVEAWAHRHSLLQCSEPNILSAGSERAICSF